MPPPAIRTVREDATDQVAADIFVNNGRLPNIKYTPAGPCGGRFAPADMDMCLRVPKLIFGGRIAMPAEPPIHHRRGDTGHGRAHADPHAAVLRQDPAVFQNSLCAEQVAIRLVNAGNQNIGYAATIKRRANMRCQRGKFWVEKSGVGLCIVCLAITQIATGNWLTVFHDTRPI